MFTPSCELVSASILQRIAIPSRKWTLKRVQGDGRSMADAGTRQRPRARRPDPGPHRPDPARLRAADARLLGAAVLEWLGQRDLGRQLPRRRRACRDHQRQPRHVPSDGVRVRLRHGRDDPHRPGVRPPRHRGGAARDGHVDRHLRRAGERHFAARLDPRAAAAPFARDARRRVRARARLFARDLRRHAADADADHADDGAARRRRFR